MTETWPGWKKNAASFLCRHYPRQGPALPDLPPAGTAAPREEPSCKCPPAFWMNSQPAWWKSGRWNNPDLLSRVISGKRRFSIFSRRTGKTWRGVSEGFFSHPFEFPASNPYPEIFPSFPETGIPPTTPAIFQKPWTPRLLPHPSVSTAAVHHRHIQQSQYPLPYFASQNACWEASQTLFSFLLVCKIKYIAF